jgi:multicomponent Na+:H+ antiporter subunit C
VSAAVMVALLVAGGVYLVLQRGLVRVTLGFVMLGHAANLVLLAAGGTGRRDEPLLGTTSPADAADPLPQAFALTAIVITFGITVYLLALASSGGDAEADEQEGPPAEGPGERRSAGPVDHDRAADASQGGGPRG